MYIKFVSFSLFFLEMEFIESYKQNSCNQNQKKNWTNHHHDDQDDEKKIPKVSSLSTPF